MNKTELKEMLERARTRRRQTLDLLAAEELKQATFYAHGREFIFAKKSLNIWDVHSKFR